MKAWIFLTATSVVSVLLNAQPVTYSIFNNSDSTSVTGKVDGYSPKQEQQFINYFTYDITGRQKKFIAPLEKGGKFSFKLLQQYEGDIAIQYGANFIKLYAKPGEKIEIDIDNNVADKVFHFPGAFKIKGPSADISNHILRFFQIYLPKLDERTEAFSLLRSTDEFVKKYQAYLEEDLEFLNKYISKNYPPETFNAWAKNWLIYEAAGMIAIKPFLGKINSSLSDTQLVSYLKNIPIRNENALRNSSYYEFINRITGGFQMVTNNNPVYKQSSGSEHASIPSLKLIDQYFKGITRELAYYNCYAFNAHSEMAVAKMETVWEIFDAAITDNFIQHELEFKRNSSLNSFTPYNVIDRIRKFPVDSSVKQNLLAILENEKGRYLYIDFWGSWCKPCMAEMPHYKSFIEAMKGEPVVFLFLAVETNDREMKKTKEKYGIQAHFISLDKNSTDIANEVFGFSSYPSHFLIDPQGNLLTKKLMGVQNKQEVVNFIKALIR